MPFEGTRCGVGQFFCSRGCPLPLWGLTFGLPMTAWGKTSDSLFQTPGAGKPWGFFIATDTGAQRCSGTFYRRTGVRATPTLTKIYCAAVIPTVRSRSVSQ